MEFPKGPAHGDAGDADPLRRHPVVRKLLGHGGAGAEVAVHLRVHPEAMEAEVGDADGEAPPVESLRPKAGQQGQGKEVGAEDLPEGVVLHEAAEGFQDAGGDPVQDPYQGAFLPQPIRDAVHRLAGPVGPFPQGLVASGDEGPKPGRGEPQKIHQSRGSRKGLPNRQGRAAVSVSRLSVEHPQGLHGPPPFLILRCQGSGGPLRGHHSFLAPGERSKAFLQKNLSYLSAPGPSG